MAQAERHDWRALFDTGIGGSLALSANANDLLRINVMPCALVYIDREGKGSPNCTRVDPFCYVEQAITLNRSLLAAGMPTLTIVTNARREIQRYLASVDASVRPELRDLAPSLTLPRTTRFYAAHFKLDLLEQIGKCVGAGTLVLLLDTDMVALRQLDQDVLRRCYRSGVGAFDISDQEFFAYGAARVVGDLEIVAGKRLNNPRWFGGECLLVSASFIQVLMPRARECFERYTLAMQRLNHNGDEAFISAALNLLADSGHQILDVGAYQLVGRHWSGNTHRDLRWFRHCSLLHLPGRKRMLERQARMADFKLDHIWWQIVSAHLLACIATPTKRLLRRKWNASRQRASVSRSLRRAETRLDVLLVDSEPKTLSRLASMLTSRGMTVMCTVDPAEALGAAKSTHPRVVVMANMSRDREAVPGIESLSTSSERSGRPFVIALYREGDHADPAQWDEWFPGSVEMGELVETVIRRARSSS
ncbi:MAG: hypothetical protein QOC89_1154 [Paraburkholderia sp.]|uniref:response regulator n=1 Tax=Paraburkholderia sp. TaxID=1926495 RepID=UPI002AFEB6E4|nr:response regulator [Paraburkholderia sp.]MEA3083457.1 hypothetical protein [Paraburkholderia sp.]